MSSNSPMARHGLIRRGAEADLLIDETLDGRLVLKRRIQKRYRITVLDNVIRSRRTVREAQLLHEAKMSGIVTPGVVFVDRKNFEIYMQHASGNRVRDVLGEKSSSERKKLCVEIGRSIGRLHRKEIIHGDLTTSNFILMPNNVVAIVDFGLGFHSNSIEDRGVDLFLLFRMLESHHFRIAQEAVEGITRGYTAVVGEKLTPLIINKTQEIKRRGRYIAERWVRER